MSAIIPVCFNDFMAMVTRSHVRLQIYYSEKNSEFKCYVFFENGLIYFSKKSYSEILNGDNIKTSEGKFKIYAFKKNYLSDGIRVEKVFLPEMKEREFRIPKNQIEAEEYNTNELLNIPITEKEILLNESDKKSVNDLNKEGI